MLLNRPRFCLHRFDIEDEMEPEMEEAFENFCLESERKRQQWHEREHLWALTGVLVYFSHFSCWNVEKQRKH